MHLNSQMSLNRGMVKSLLNMHKLSDEYFDQLDAVIEKLKFPLKRFVNFFCSADCKIGYFNVWRAIKSFNLTFL